MAYDPGKQYGGAEEWDQVVIDSGPCQRHTQNRRHSIILMGYVNPVMQYGIERFAMTRLQRVSMV
jgi:hypothetical protein